MIKILQGFVTDQNGGISQYIYNNYKYINKEKYQYDFIYLNEKPSYFDECASLGARFYYLPRKIKFISYLRRLYNIIRFGNYDIICFNISFADAIPVLISKLAGAKSIILHAHSTSIEHDKNYKRLALYIYHKFSKLIYKLLNITVYCACSKEAGKFVFGDTVLQKQKLKILHNAIDVNKFTFDSKKRAVIREQLGIKSDQFVVGHIGRFSYAKNHDFLIDIFNEIIKQNRKAVLILVGKGPLEDLIRKKVKNLGLCNSVKFLGTRKDIPNLLCGFDCLILPSRFEGFGIVGLEAQASGLYTYFSDCIPSDIAVTELAIPISLKGGSKRWASEILLKGKSVRRIMLKPINEAGYNIVNEISRIENIYENIKWRL